MGKKKQNSGIGRSLIKDRFGGGHKKAGESSHLHTSELEDGYDWNRINFKSVTEENTLDEFLATAELAGTEFTAEKLNFKIVSSEIQSGLLSAEEEAKVRHVQRQHFKMLKIPRRPQWDELTTAAELDKGERDSFLEWRRQLAELQEVKGLILTPFEKNLDFWRQLWRVIERSEIIVQIVDARNPLLFFCEDLAFYVKEVDIKKVNMVLINKADYLSQAQREMWAEHFNKIGVRVAFWSAALQSEKNKENEGHSEEEDDGFDDYDDDDEDDDEDDDDEDDDNDDNDNDDDEWEDVDGSSGDEVEDMDLDNESKDKTQRDIAESEKAGSERMEASSSSQSDLMSTENTSTPGEESKSNTQRLAEMSLSEDASASACSSCTKNMSDNTDCDNTKEHGTVPLNPPLKNLKNSPDILDGEALLQLLKSLHTRPMTYTPGVITAGLVGYPNVGKSSTINALCQTKKVPVSATPGRTKHFQTVYLDSDLMLCDCPGLVMPSFVSTKAHMVLNGILPIDQMRDYVPPTALLCKQLGRSVLEITYGINLPRPQEGEEEDRPPTAHEFLGAHACMRGFMTHKGIPDFQRSSRQVLKDYVTGKLLYSQPPPDVPDEAFCPVAVPSKTGARPRTSSEGQGGSAQQAEAKTKQKPLPISDVDKAFFSKMEPRAGSKGVQGVMEYTRKDGFTSHRPSGVATSGADTPHASTTSLNVKSWKRHNNKNKKEKLRRITSHLDA